LLYCLFIWSVPVVMSRSEIRSVDWGWFSFRKKG
jgi:hypothetical protein